MSTLRRKRRRGAGRIKVMTITAGRWIATKRPSAVEGRCDCAHYSLYRRDDQTGERAGLTAPQALLRVRA